MLVPATQSVGLEGFLRLAECYLQWVRSDFVDGYLRKPCIAECISGFIDTPVMC